MSLRKALIVEDRPEVIFALRPVLCALQFEVDSARTLVSAIRKIETFSYDIIVLDRSLPDGDGLDLLSILDDFSNQTRTIVVSGYGSPEQRVLGLRKGADDYLAKPFSTEELAARIQALMKRSKRLASGLQAITKNAKYDYEHHRLHFSQDCRQLTSGEAKLFELFLRHPLHQLTREIISTRLWNAEEYPTATAVDVAMKRLRDRLLGSPLHIETVRKIGYTLKDS